MTNAASHTSPTSQAALPTRQLSPSAINHLVMAGWAGRNTAAVEAHIRELEELGTPRPSRTPIFYRVAAALLTVGDRIQVVGNETSGEVELVLASLDDGMWVGLGSDHTDRALERSNVALSKQLCAKVAAPELWRFADVAQHWDRLILRSWAHRAGGRELYQEGTAAALLPAERLLELYKESEGGLPARGAMFGGTIATVHAIAPADSFEMELEDPVLQRRLRHHYHIETLPANA
jgi:hypothetical protein